MPGGNLCAPRGAALAFPLGRWRGAVLRAANEACLRHMKHAFGV